MSDLWFAGCEDVSSVGGGDSPDPVSWPLGGTIGWNLSWSWNLVFSTDSNQSTYARTSLNSITDLGGGYVFSGIIRYVTQNPDGSFVDHPVGLSNPGGVVDCMWDSAVVAVTFGWGIGGSAGGGPFSVAGIFAANINMEVWVTG
jgi:hypothetical protein